MLDPVKNFLFQKFWLPIIDESVYYNPYNTVVLALLFGALVLYVLKPVIRKMEIQIDENFVKGFIPFIIFGGLLRALKDVNAVNTILLETPFIYLVLIAIGIAILLFSKKLEEFRNIPYHKTLGIISTALVLMIVPFYSLKEPGAVVLFTVATVTWAAAGFLLITSIRPDLLNWEFTVPVTAHFLDATSTFTALTYGANEKHVLGRFAIDIFGNWGMFLLKGAVIIPIVFYIRENFEGEEKIFYLFIITLLGLGIATRNLIQTLAIS